MTANTIDCINGMCCVRTRSETTEKKQQKSKEMGRRKVRSLCFLG